MSVGIFNLCPAAIIYLAISIISMVIMASKIFGTDNIFSIGSYQFDAPIQMNLLFLIKAIYILFWTWTLNVICRKVSEKIAFMIALFPFVLFFVLLFGSSVLNVKIGFQSDIIFNKKYTSEYVDDKKIINDNSKTVTTNTNTTATDISKMMKNKNGIFSNIEKKQVTTPKTVDDLQTTTAPTKKILSKDELTKLIIEKVATAMNSDPNNDLKTLEIINNYKDIDPIDMSDLLNDNSFDVGNVASQYNSLFP